MPVPRAALQCTCGNVLIEFVDPAASWRYECCCIDCLQKCKWCAFKGGPPLPWDLLTYKRPMDLVYLSNHFCVVRGYAHLGFCKLRVSSSTVNMYSKCCHTMLMVDHLIFMGRGVQVFPDVCRLSAEPFMSPMGRIFTKDFPAHKLAELPPCIVRREEEKGPTCIVRLGNELHSRGLSFEEMRAIRFGYNPDKLWIIPSEIPDGFTNFQKLLAEAGDFTILRLKEGADPSIPRSPNGKPRWGVRRFLKWWFSRLITY